MSINRYSWCMFFVICRYYADELLDSPTLAQVTSTEVSAERTFSVGSGLTVGEAGHPLVFQIVLADIFGNRCNGFANPLSMAYPTSSSFHLLHLKANASLRITTVSRSIVPVSLSFDVRSNVFRALATPAVSGTYNLDVSYKPNRTRVNSAAFSLSRTNIHGSTYEVT